MKKVSEFFKELEEEKKDKYDEGEYDQEGDMAKSDLRSIIANAQKLHDMIDDADNLPEWVQSKITVAEDYISTVANYMTAEMSEAAKLTPQQKFKNSMKRAGYDMDAGAKRLQDLLAKQKKEREEREKKNMAEGDSGAKYKVKSIGKDSKGDYYMSPSTGKKVYKSGVNKGDHENPKTGEIKNRVAEGIELQEAEKNGKKVQLNKPFRTSDGKGKFAVYTKNEKGNVVKVNFGDTTGLTIKTSNPDRRRNFRARHNCDNPGPKHKARYWSCRAWSRDTVSAGLGT